MSTALSTSASKITPSNTTAEVFNIEITLANTEYSFTLPVNTKRFVLKGRTLFPLKMAYDLDQSGVTYFSIPAGCTFVDESYYVSQKIYFQSTQPEVILEIIAYH